MREAAELVNKMIECLFKRATQFDLQPIIRHFFENDVQTVTCWDQLYVLKKIYSMSRCLIADNTLTIKIEPELLAICREAFSIYIFYILQMLPGYSVANCYSLVLTLCKHFCALLPAHKWAESESDRVQKRLSELVPKFVDGCPRPVSNKTVISGHESNLNILLIFMLTDLSNFDEGYSRLQKIKSYPADFGSGLIFELESCITCVSGYEVIVYFNDERIMPFFATNQKHCDLLEFLEYSDILLSSQQMNFKFRMRK